MAFNLPEKSTMKYLSVFFAILFHLSVFSQDERKKAIESGTSTLQIVTLKPNGTNAYKDIFGTVIKNKYFLTCFHTLSNDDGMKYVKMRLLYNRKGSKSDSLSFYENERDFKQILNNPVYKKNDHSTDYIFIPINKRLKSKNPDFDTSSIAKNDSLYAMGPFMGSIIPSIFEVLYEDREFENKGVEFIVIFGLSEPGFSGSPVFNSKGKIVGMIQFGIENNFQDYFLKKLKAGKITRKKYDDIIKGYKIGMRANYVIKSKYLLDQVPKK